MDMTKTDRRPLREEQLRVFLLEDLGYGDITSEALIPPEQRARARLFFKEPGVAAGLEEASVIFTMLGCEVKHLERDGNWVPPGKVLLEFDGPARSLLLGERVALNLVSHMAGIATATAEVVEKVRKTSPSTRVAATRKTTPGLRDLEKRAVELGGGDTHRLGLDDCVLIKDNHLELLPSVSEAVHLARQRVSFTKKIEVEVRSHEEAEEAARAGADIIMFDNMDPSTIRESLRRLVEAGLRAGRLFEASGGITAENAADYAAAGVDVVSLGSLTHSVRALDVKLEIMMTGGARA
jgi:nicotinate-nucleotide pyrophosphorylase (carboxylating)